MGNICRSPTAEGVFRKFVEDAGLSEWIVTDSAGTHGYHVGDPPDRRASSAAERRGILLNDLRARQVHAEDFERFDHILAMDEDNLELLLQQSAPQHRAKVRLLLDFSSSGQREVPDPYYGGGSGFPRGVPLVADASPGLLRTPSP